VNFSRLIIFLGAAAKYNEELKLPMEEHYIHYVHTQPSKADDGPIEIIVTMNLHLAALLHSARATLHNTTYKRLWGKHNEWEVVIWDEK